MYGMTAGTIILMFNGIGTFLQNPFDTRRFIVYYIGVSFLPILPTSDRHSTQC